jgi:Hemerythrin HHE cation binding domain
MRADGGAPADTRTMGIVHSALRRDLERTRVALTTAPYPDGARRRAIGDHLLAMLHFLHVHHHGEDAGLWPMVLRKDPSTAPLLERMERDHEQIAPAISALEKAAEGYGSDALDREPLVSALAGLTEVLLPHLEREETEALPVVSATLTRRDWDAYEQDHAIKVKRFVELGDEGQWVLDGLGEEDRRVMLALVPALPRFIVLYGFARRYRRKAALLWGDGPASRIPSLSLDSLRERA